MSGKQPEKKNPKKNKNKSQLICCWPCAIATPRIMGVCYVTWVLYLSLVLFAPHCDPAILIICTCVRLCPVRMCMIGILRVPHHSEHISCFSLLGIMTHRVARRNEYHSFGTAFVIVLSFQLKRYFPKRDLPLPRNTSKPSFRSACARYSKLSHVTLEFMLIGMHVAQHSPKRKSIIQMEFEQFQRCNENGRVSHSLAMRRWEIESRWMVWRYFTKSIKLMFSMRKLE